MIITFTDTILVSTYFLLLFLAIFWMIVLFSSPEHAPQKGKIRRYPFVSVIVPAYNEQRSIQETLNSLINLDYPKNKIEIIVVNDGSKDKTQEIVTRFIQEHPFNVVTLINQHNGGKGNALNNGLRNAQGEFFACLDADSFVAPNALKEMLPYFESDKTVAAVCPLLKVKDPKSVLQKVQWCEYIINMFHKMLNAKLDCVHVTPGPFSIYRTKVITDLGGYDEHTTTEDLEIAIRLQKYHYKIVQTFDATVETIAPNTWKTLFKQRVRWYKGGIDNAINYKSLMFNKKYGDFGFVRMPTIILSGAVAIVLALTLFQEVLKRVYNGLVTLYAVRFDLITLITNYKFHFNFLTWPFFKITIATTLIMISLYVMIKSYQVVKEKITNYGRTWLSMSTYLLIYSLFLAIIWIYIAFLITTKKKDTWS